MSINIQIIREGIPEESTQLVPGEYILGRGWGCDIILDDKSVSKNHATLSVSSNTVTINDTGSVNGIYYHGERIKSRVFDGDFEVEIGPFILKGTLEKKIDKLAKDRLSIVDLASSNIKIILSFSLIVVMVVTFATVYFPLNSKVESFQRLELVKRGIILAKYLSEMNTYFVEKGQYDLVRTNPIPTAEGVIYSFVVDAGGKIIAPVEDTGDFLDWPKLPEAMKEGKPKISEGKRKEKIIFYPIKKLDKTIGAAIIGYDIERAGKASGPDIKGSSCLLLVVLLVVCGILGKLLIKAFLRPLQKLEEEVSVSLKEGRDHVAFKSPYKEIDNLVRAFNRLLIRAPIATTDTPVETGPSNSNDVGEDALDSYVSRLKQITSPWCIVDKAEYIIIHYNQSFSTTFGKSRIKQRVHLAEAFDSPEITNAVCELIDNPEGERAVTVNRERPLEIKKTAIKGEENKALLIFEESSNG